MAIPKEIQKAGYYAAEKSIWVTGPATVVFIAKEVVTPGLGIAMLAGDIFLSHQAGKRRKAL